MNRTKLICHMMTTLDGKSVGKYEEIHSYPAQLGDYLKIHKRINAHAVIMGRTTYELMSADILQPQLENVEATPIPRKDFFADHHKCEKYVVAIDPSGKLIWTTDQMSLTKDGTYEHIVQILTEQVSDAYLTHLQKIGVSYIFGGKDYLDLHLVLEKLKSCLSIEDALLEGGGILNGSFLQQNLIDEMSLFLVPVVDGGTNAQTIVETLPKYGESFPVEFKLKNIEKLEYGLHLHYGK